MSGVGANAKRNGLPFLERTQTGAAVAANGIKAEIAALMREAANELGIEILVMESPIFAPNPYVRVLVWNRNPSDSLVTYRSSCYLTILPTDYCAFPYEITLKITSPYYPVEKVIDGIVIFRKHDAIELLRSLLKAEKAPRFSRCRPKTEGWKLWLPKNKVAILRPDYTATALVWGLFLGLLLMLPFSEYILWLALVAVVCVVGLILMPKTLQTMSCGRPPADPFVLLDQDEWQSAVRGLGPDAAALEQSLEDDLRASLPEGASVHHYPETYIGEDSVLFKKRLLVRHRRAAVFVDVESYKDEIYIGWESKLNRGTWTETLVGTGINRRTGARCKVFTVRGAQGSVQRQDAQDAIFLGEFVHSKIRHWLRHYLDQRSLEERIDFEIVRSGREALPEEKGIEKHKNAFKKLLRID